MMFLWREIWWNLSYFDRMVFQVSCLTCFRHDEFSFGRRLELPRNLTKPQNVNDGFSKRNLLFPEYLFHVFHRVFFDITFQGCIRSICCQTFCRFWLDTLKPHWVESWQFGKWKKGIPDDRVDHILLFLKNIPCKWLKTLTVSHRSTQGDFGVSMIFSHLSTSAEERWNFTHRGFPTKNFGGRIQMAEALRLELQVSPKKNRCLAWKLGIYPNFWRAAPAAVCWFWNVCFFFFNSRELRMTFSDFL